MTHLVAEEMRGGYGAADILQDCSLEVARGEIAIIVGPNGAGKSTALKAIFGLLGLRGGSVRFEGEEITGVAPQERVALGMGFVPQSANIFATMTVEENLEMGAYIRTDDYTETVQDVLTLFPALTERRRQAAGELSGGLRQQVAIGRALMTRPSLLLLDEPTAGLSPIVMDQLFDRITGIAKEGVAILMVEQNARQALSIADKGYVLVQGQNRFSGAGRALLENPDVRQSFLGG